jgi:uncharacterized phage protein (TIGR01671 family)
MREILFKAQRVDTKEWVEGDFVRNAFNGVNRSIPFGIQENGCFPREVIPETVCQFTGLLDKNGKKIFEGDIIEWKETRSFVIYSFDGFRFNSYMNGQHGIKEAVCCDIGYGDGVVVGNIHDGEVIV